MAAPLLKRGWLQLYENDTPGPLLWVSQSETHLAIFQSNLEFHCAADNIRTADISRGADKTFGFDLLKANSAPSVIGHIRIGGPADKSKSLFVGDELIELNKQNVQHLGSAQVETLLHNLSKIQLKVRNDIAVRAIYEPAPQDVSKLRKLTEISLVNARVAIHELNPRPPKSNGSFTVGSSDGSFECILVSYFEGDAEQWVSTLRQAIWKVTIKKAVLNQAEFEMPSSTEVRRSIDAHIDFVSAAFSDGNGKLSPLNSSHRTQSQAVMSKAGDSKLNGRVVLLSNGTAEPSTHSDSEIIVRRHASSNDSTAIIDSVSSSQNSTAIVDSNPDLSNQSLSVQEEIPETSFGSSNPQYESAVDQNSSASPAISDAPSQPQPQPQSHALPAAQPQSQPTVFQKPSVDTTVSTPVSAVIALNTHATRSPAAVPRSTRLSGLAAPPPPPASPRASLDTIPSSPIPRQNSLTITPPPSFASEPAVSTPGSPFRSSRRSMVVAPPTVFNDGAPVTPAASFESTDAKHSDEQFSDIVARMRESSLSEEDAIDAFGPYTINQSVSLKEQAAQLRAKMAERKRKLEERTRKDVAKARARVELFELNKKREKVALREACVKLDQDLKDSEISARTKMHEQLALYRKLIHDRTAEQKRSLRAEVNLYRTLCGLAPNDVSSTSLSLVDKSNHVEDNTPDHDDSPAGKMSRRATIQNHFQKSEKRRQHIMEEVLSSEKSYVDTLLTIKKVFMDPMLESMATSKPLIGAEEYDVIFFALNDIISLNMRILQRLHTRMQDGWNSSIAFGDIFVQFMNDLKVYTGFVNNFPRSMATIDLCIHQHPPFSEFLEESRKRNECRMLGLREMMLTPIQRIPRYQLLLGGLVQNTEQSHSDYKALAFAFEQIRSLAVHLNEAKREAERQQEIELVAGMIKECPDHIVSPVWAGRKFLLELSFNEMIVKTGGVSRAADSIGKVKQECLFFLFSDLLVIGKKTRQKKGFKAVHEVNFPLDQIKVEDLAKVVAAGELLLQIVKLGFNKVYKALDLQAKSDFIRTVSVAQHQLAAEASETTFV